MDRIKNLKKLKDNTNHERVLSLIGGMMIYFAFGGVSTWGSVNVYFASYYSKELSPELFVRSANIILASLGLPLGIGAIFSLRLAKYIGFKTTFLLGSFLYSIGVFLSAFATNFYVFAFFYCFVSNTAACLAYSPIIYAIWNHFPEKKGQMSGIMFGVFGVSNLFFVPLESYLVNPNNEKADIKIKIGEDEFFFFSESVYQNVPKMLAIVGTIYFCFSLIGAFLLQNPPSEPEENQSFSKKPYFKKVESPEKIVLTRKLPEDEPYNAETISTQASYKELNGSSAKECENEFKPNKKSSISDSNKIFYGEHINALARDKSQDSHEELPIHEESSLLTNKGETFTRECPDIKTGIMSSSFILLFMCSLVVAMFSIFLNINFKTFGFTKINNDRFMTILGFLNGISSCIGRLFWGFIIDKFSFKKTLIIVQGLLGFFSITFIWASSGGYYIYTAWVVGIAFFDGGIMCILGPGLCKIFGMKIGSLLYPIKALSFYLGLLLVPLLQFLLIRIISMEWIFFILGLGNVGGLIMACLITEVYWWRTK